MKRFSNALAVFVCIFTENYKKTVDICSFLFYILCKMYKGSNAFQVFDFLSFYIRARMINKLMQGKGFIYGKRCNH